MAANRRSVWSRWAWLADNGQPVGVEAGEDHATLNLGAGNRHVVLHAAQGTAVDGEGSVVAALPPDDAGAHGAQWADDTAHRTSPDLVRAGEKTGELLARQQSGEQANGCAGVAAVEHIIRLLQAVEAAPVDEQLGGALFLDIHAEATHDAHGLPAVAAVQEVGDAADAFGDGGKHDSAVADRFVAGDVAASFDRRPALDADAGHSEFLGFILVAGTWLVHSRFMGGCAVSKRNDGPGMRSVAC